MKETVTETWAVMRSQHDSEGESRCCVWCNEEVKRACEVNGRMVRVHWLESCHTHTHTNTPQRPRCPLGVLSD